MTQAVDRPGMDKIRLGSWMMIAGTLGAVLALLTWIDVWNASDSKPTGWALVGVACAVLALGGFAVFWQGLTIKSRASSGSTPEPPPGP
jgi:Na+/melibiose symporter-like transporter